MTPLLYEPWRLDDETLAATFVGHLALVERLERDLRADADRTTSRHFLLLGPRGCGKSHLAALVARRMAVVPGWRVVRFPEDHPRVTHLADLLEQLVVLLDGASPFLDEPEPSRVVERAVDHLRRRPGPCLVVVENLAALLHTLGRRDERRLRELLMRDAPFTLLATSSTPVASYVDDPFHSFFQPFFVPELPIDDGVRLVERWGASPTRARAAWPFLGGNPRMLLRLAQEPAGPTLADELLRLFDRVTPEYQARLARLSPQMARIVAEMAVAPGPSTPSELGRRARLPANQVAANLSRLAEARLVEPTSRPDRRSRRYEVVERPFRLWLSLREDPAAEARLRALAAFFEHDGGAAGGPHAEPWATAARVRLAPDPESALAALFPEERDAVRRVLGP